MRRGFAVLAGDRSGESTPFQRRNSAPNGKRKGRTGMSVNCSAMSG